MDASEKLSPILGVPAEKLRAFFEETQKRTGRDAAGEVSEGIETSVERVLFELRVTKPLAPLEAKTLTGFEAVALALEQAIAAHAAEMRALAETMPGANEFERAAELARQIARVKKGFFLKRDRAAQILRTRPPVHVLEYLKVSDADALLAAHDVTEVMSALRFMETDEWMHETFDAAYSAFTPEDFEERDLEIRVLSPVWQPVAEAFVKKKHHNVSHLKEFGVIFINPVRDVSYSTKGTQSDHHVNSSVPDRIDTGTVSNGVNPIREDSAVKFLRDFALLFHYAHEIDFYADLFRQYALGPDFSTHLKSLLRGDVPERTSTEPGEWLIVQRYLAKIDPKDPRLFLPRVNPESVHWRRAERDLADYARGKGLGLALWKDLDFVEWIAPGGLAASFDLEDVAMTAVAAGEGSQEFLTYHQREALWTELFTRYAGGEDMMQKLLLENFLKGSVQF